MPYSLMTGGTTLYALYADGTTSALTLPGDVAALTKTLRGAVLNRQVVLVNGLSRPVWVDPRGTVRSLALGKPASAPTLAAGAAGSLSGTFRVRCSFIVKDDYGTLLAEGPLGPISASVTVASQLIALSAIPVSGNPSVTGRRFYRTATGPGTSYFEWFDLDDNTTTTISEEGSDEALSILPAPDDLGAIPANVELIAEWKRRLWAKSATEPDRLYGSADGKFYAWPLEFEVGPVGKDNYGITGFLPRRDELGIGRRGIIWKLTGDDEDDFRLVKLVEGIGVLAPDSCAVIRDVGYFLGIREGQVGVYRWSSSGVEPISDDKVYPWFNTSTYFNQSQFKSAFGGYNPETDSYELHLCATGGTTVNRWVSYSISDGKWLGPHKSDALTPACRAILLDANEVPLLGIGASDGKVYQRQATRTDGASTAVDLDVTTNFLFGEPPAPDITHFWGELSALTKKESGGTLTITPKVGGLDASAGSAISHTLTTGRQRLRRLGVGRGVQLRFQQATAGQDTELYGVEIPWHEVGRR